MRLFNKKADVDERITSASDEGDNAGSSREGSVKKLQERDPLDRLEPEQREALLAQIETPKTKPVNLFGLTRYASKQDRVLQGVALLTCIAAGAALVLSPHAFHRSRLM